MYKCFCFIILLLFSPLPSQAQATKELSDICRQLDTEIQRWPEYKTKRQMAIDSLYKALYAAEGPDNTFDCCLALIDAYQDFQNDSALYYCKMLGEIAPWTNDKKDKETAKMMMARQAVRSGMYEAALDYLNQVDTTAIGSEGKITYHQVCHFAYMEMAAYCYIWSKRDEYINQEHVSLHRLLGLLPEDSGEWLMYKAYDLLLDDKYEDADRLSRQCLDKVERYGTIYRDAAFHRRFICESLHQEEEACYWLAECAISELRQGCVDQVGVWSLASKIEKDHLDKSYEYVRFAWDVISYYGVNLRSWQIAPVLSSIEHQYQEEKQRHTRVITIGLVVLALLALMLAFSLFYVNKQRKHLATARRQLQESNQLLQESNANLEEANAKLSALNKQLSEVNAQLFTSNAQLSDANHAKEEYIVSLLAYNSDFIDQKEEERREQSKMLRNGKMKELTRILNAADKTGKELGQLLARFDDIFLGLYPTFVEDFNALLIEEGQIKVNKIGKMNTPLRIFALLRLGIDQIPDVAKILHCSPQTIYNYRTNLKNSCRFDRDLFEDAVRNIGMPVLVGDLKTL